MRGCHEGSTGRRLGRTGPDAYVWHRALMMFFYWAPLRLVAGLNILYYFLSAIDFGFPFPNISFKNTLQYLLSVSDIK